jgi:hypothetical protein
MRVSVPFDGGRTGESVNGGRYRKMVDHPEGERVERQLMRIAYDNMRFAHKLLT